MTNELKIIYNYSFMAKSSTPKKSTYYKNHYPVKKTVADVPVRKVNVISLYLPEGPFEKVLRLSEKTKLSAAKIIALSSKPCSCCKDIPVEVKTIDGIFLIPRGLIVYKKTNSGVTIINNKKRKS